MDNLFDNLFIFEMANNHQGSVDHGISIIKEMGHITKKYKINAAVKFQYRQIDTFIHPDFRNDTEQKHIGRFIETQLLPDQFVRMVNSVKEEGMTTICTPFDERSVDQIIDHNIDIIKIASVSSDDWPLLEKIVKTNRPIIASTGGLSIEKIDNLVSFLLNRDKKFAILHCIGIYPTPKEYFNLNFISRLKKRFPNIKIGYSGHESPDNLDVIKIATALGAEIFERHVGLPTSKIKLNNYSMNPEQVSKWIEAHLDGKLILGNSNKEISEMEMASLFSLKRGVYVNRKIRKGQAIQFQDVFFAMPCQKGQLNSGEFGRVRARFVASRNYDQNDAVFESCDFDREYKIRKIIHETKGMLSEAKIVLSNAAEVELSHHYGLENFPKFGCLIINLVNREYCKKIIVVFPGQHHPEQKHLKKEETFHVLQGELIISLNGITQTLKTGDIITIERGVLHSFYSVEGTIFEEISSTHFRNDSFYTDKLISDQDPMSRKTVLQYL